jgi:hypothetical protein
VAELSLLASLSSKFRDKPENIATIALEHILSRSEVARDVLTRQAFLGSEKTPLVAYYRAQTQEESTRPDLAGFDENGVEVVLIEAKFWAGLTDQQPNGYISRLKDEGSVSLCFVVPESRRSSLWLEVLERAAKDFDSKHWSDGATYSKRLSPHRTLGMVTWHGLLRSMIEATSAAGDLKTTHDIEQLVSFCEYLEQEGFLPLKSEDLGPAVPRLLGQLITVVDQAVDNGRASSKYSTKGFNPTSARERFTRYFESRNIRLALSVHYGFWIKHSVSPVWLQFQGGVSGPEHKAFMRARESFRNLEVERSRRMIMNEDGSPLFPIRLPMGVDLDTVVGKVIEQIDSIVDLVVE